MRIKKIPISFFSGDKLILQPMTTAQTHFLLASQSPRRQQLFADCNLDFKVVKIDADEDFSDQLQPHEVCEFLASHKSNHYQLPLQENQILVTADTIVFINGQILNKPANSQQAFDMLSKLSGNTHQVYTGVCMRSALTTHVFHDKTDVTFSALTPAEITHYIENYKPFDKAGSYGVQDWMGLVGVKGINGCFYNVMGFPMAKFWQEWKLHFQ